MKEHFSSWEKKSGHQICNHDSAWCLDPSLLLEGVEEVGGGAAGLVGVIPDVGQRYQLVGETVGGRGRGRATGFGVESNLL